MKELETMLETTTEQKRRLGHRAPTHGAPDSERSQRHTGRAPVAILWLLALLMAEIEFWLRVLEHMGP
jgi:hypothetical protein